MIFLKSANSESATRIKKHMPTSEPYIILYGVCIYPIENVSFLSITRLFPYFPMQCTYMYSVDVYLARHEGIIIYKIRSDRCKPHHSCHASIDPSRRLPFRVSSFCVKLHFVFFFLNRPNILLTRIFAILTH